MSIFFSSISPPLHSTSHSCSQPACPSSPATELVLLQHSSAGGEIQNTVTHSALAGRNQQEMKVGTRMKVFKCGLGQLREVPSEPHRAVLKQGWFPRVWNSSRGILLDVFFLSFSALHINNFWKWLLFSEQLFQTLSRLRERRKFWVLTHPISNSPS